jgi:hypothetical protein
MAVAHVIVWDLSPRVQTTELYTADTLAIDHIVKNSTIYQKRVVAQGANNRLAGEGMYRVCP